MVLKRLGGGAYTWDCTNRQLKNEIKPSLSIFTKRKGKKWKYNSRKFFFGGGWIYRLNKLKWRKEAEDDERTTH